MIKLNKTRVNGKKHKEKYLNLCMWCAAPIHCSKCITGLLYNKLLNKIDPSFVSHTKNICFKTVNFCKCLPQYLTSSFT